ncbi:MAG: hypothetical protein ABSF34_11110 [Verrucomicrobiota bacterium]
MKFFSNFAVFIVLFMATVLRSPATETDGLYYVSSGEKAGIIVLQAYIYSVNNANADFDVRLDTSDYQIDPKTSTVANPVSLRIDGHDYPCSGGGGKTGGPWNVLEFRVHGQAAAEAIATWFSTNCSLRSPPGYKLYSQFIPSKTIFNTNEPVIVKFQLKNADERTVIFQRGGQQRGYRDNQYGFRAQFSDQKVWGQAVPDVGSPVNHGGVGVIAPLVSGKTFEDQIDLKKWFAFDKPGTYMIHGFYQLDLYQEAFMPWNVVWRDYASADFTVVIK